MKDNKIAELVNTLRDIAVRYTGTQQLRAHISRAVQAGIHDDQQRIIELEEALKSCAVRNHESQRTIESLTSSTITVKLPSQTDFDDPLSAYEAIEKCKDALTAAGIKWDAE